MAGLKMIAQIPKPHGVIEAFLRCYDPIARNDLEQFEVCASLSVEKWTEGQKSSGGIVLGSLCKPAYG